MSGLPAILGEGRTLGVTLVTATALGQAVAAGVAAFATRDVFRALHHGDIAVPALALGLLLLAGVTVASLRLTGHGIAEKLGQDYAISLRRALFDHLTRMPAGAVANRRTGGLALRFVGDLTTARNWVGLSIARIISSAIVIPAGAAVLFALNPTLGGAAVLPLALFLVGMLVLAPRVAPLHRRLRHERAKLAIDMMERVAVAPELLLMGRDKAELKKADRRGQDLRGAAVGRVLGAAALRSLPDFGTAAATAALLWVAFRTGAAPAEAAASLAVLAILVQPMRDLAGVWDRWCAWCIAREKCLAVLSSPALELPKRPPRPRARGPARIAFKDVRKGPLRTLDAVVAPGTKVAIIGATAAGKSTCLALAAGLEHADHGSVEIDGVDTLALTRNERRRTIAYVGPRTPILRGSLRRALSLGLRPRPSDAEIEDMARDLGLGDVLHRLGGLDGRVAEGGRNLSSGEVRRAHLIRTALARPRLLLLDEAESALDAAGLMALERLLGRTAATTILATRDLAVARQADVLWHLFDGGIGELGTPEELLLADGPTARLLCPRSAA